MSRISSIFSINPVMVAMLRRFTALLGRLLGGFYVISDSLIFVPRQMAARDKIIQVANFANFVNIFDQSGDGGHVTSIHSTFGSIIRRDFT
jgi:hypothetical protein